MISGDSESGKTETCFDLVESGFEFVADDAVEFFTDGKTIFGRPTEHNQAIAYRRDSGFVVLPANNDAVPIRFEFVIDKSDPICNFDLFQYDVQQVAMGDIDAKRYAQEIANWFDRMP